MNEIWEGGGVVKWTVVLRNNVKLKTGKGRRLVWFMNLGRWVGEREREREFPPRTPPPPPPSPTYSTRYSVLFTFHLYCYYYL